MKKLLFVLLILTVVGGAAFSFDFKSFPSPIQKGDLLISPILNLGGYGSAWTGDGYGTGFVIGVTAAVDYALPIPLMVGGEAGFAVITEDWAPTSIPILARVSWHPNFEVKNLDTYVRLKMGYNIAVGGKFFDWGGGFSGGGQVGVRYFFSKSLGVFGELGYDRYGLKIKFDAPSGWFRTSYSAYAYTWFHAGVTFKL